MTLLEKKKKKVNHTLNYSKTYEHTRWFFKVDNVLGESAGTATHVRFSGQLLFNVDVLCNKDRYRSSLVLIANIDQNNFSISWKLRRIF